MVEFGLKLEDNKVSEWSEFYINYDKLKAILKKAKSAQKKYDEQAKKRPDDATKVYEAHKAGFYGAVLTTPSPSGSASNLMETIVRSVSGGSLSAMDKDEDKNKNKDEAGSSSPNTKKEEDDETEFPSERSSLLSPSTTPKAASLTQSLSNLSEKMFGGSRYEKTLRGLLKEIDDIDKDFGSVLVEEQSKSVEFYFKKLRELELMLQGLMESVSQSTVLKKAAADARRKVGDVEKSNNNNNKHSSSRVSTSALENISEDSPMDRSEASSSEQQPGVMPQRSESHPIPLPTSSLPSAPTKKSSRRSQSAGNVISRGRKRATQARFEQLLQKFQDVTSEGIDDYNDLSDEEADIEEEQALAEASSIKRSLIDQYRTSKLLHNFAIMNYTGFVKIIKKHDKTIPRKKGEFKYILESENLYHEGTAVDQLAKQYEKYFANWFCNGDTRAAQAQMNIKKGDGLDMDWSQLRLGHRMGMCAILALWVCWDCIWGLVSDGNSTIGGRAAFPVFRACGGILLLQWFWTVSVFVWTRYRVNYIYLFDFNPRIVATPLGLCCDAVDNTLVFLVLMLLYYKAGAQDIPKIIPDGGYPFVLVLYTTYNLIFPFRTRLPMWRAIWKVVTAPLHPPTFFHGYIGDIFTSFVKVFQDIAWTLCWVFSGSFTLSDRISEENAFSWSSEPWYKNVLIPLICLLPLVIRFNQCLRRYLDTGDRFPHLANATKYAMSQTVTLFGAFHPLYLEHSVPRVGVINWFQMFWTLVFVSSSLYSFFWDVVMDWGLGKRKYGWLNESLMYPKRYYYYMTIGLDLVLRFMWVQTLIPPSSGANFEVPIYLATMSMMLELFRRTIWGFLRLENEHRSNAAGFRRVGFVPLHFNTGHQHKYNKSKEKSGSSVLQEVIFIAISVVTVCVMSIIAAQRANRTPSVENVEL